MAADAGPTQGVDPLSIPWYHTIELGPGRITPGVVDWRRTATTLLPARLDGMRALDVDL